MKGLKERIIKKVNDGSIVSTEELIKFFKSHNEIKINWQNKNKKELYDSILKVYFESIDRRDVYWHVHQADVHTNIYESGLTIAKLVDGKLALEKGDHIKNTDIIMLPEFKGSDFIYFMPCSIRAFLWINHYSCGLQPAKWCLGCEWLGSSPQPFPFAFAHSHHEVFIVGIHKNQYYSQDKDVTKVLIEFSSSNHIVTNEQGYLAYGFDSNIKNGFPPHVYSANNKFLQFSESDKIALELARFLYKCWKSKEKIPLYLFEEWTEDTFKYFTTFAKESVLGIEEYKPE